MYKITKLKNHRYLTCVAKRVNLELYFDQVDYAWIKITKCYLKKNERMILSHNYNDKILNVDTLNSYISKSIF